MKRNLRNKHLFILFAILCLTGCTAMGYNDVKPVMSEDPDVASGLFPALAGIESVEMEILKYGGSHPRDALPSPTDYRYRGYIYPVGRGNRQIYGNVPVHGRGARHII